MPLKLILIGFWAAFCGKSRQNPFLLHIHTPVLSIFFHATSFIWRHGLPKLVIAKIQVPIWGFWGYAKSHWGHIATVFDAHIPPLRGCSPSAGLTQILKKTAYQDWQIRLFCWPSASNHHTALYQTQQGSADHHHKGF